MSSVKSGAIRYSRGNKHYSWTVIRAVLCLCHRILLHGYYLAYVLVRQSNFRGRNRSTWSIHKLFNTRKSIFLITKVNGKSVYLWIFGYCLRTENWYVKWFQVLLSGPSLNGLWNNFSIILLDINRPIARKYLIHVLWMVALIKFLAKSSINYTHSNPQAYWNKLVWFCLVYGVVIFSGCLK